MNARLSPKLLGLLTAAALLTACGGQRSLIAVKESGDRAYDRANYDAALVDYQEFVERLPGDPTGRFRLGRTYLKLGRPLQAREQLFIAHSQNVDDDEVAEALAESLYAAGQHEDLYKLLRNRALDRGEIEDYLRLAHFAQRTGDADEARQALLTAARLDKGKSPAVQMELVNFFESIGDRDSALERLRMAYYLAPSDGKIKDRIRAYGDVPGPSFAVRPPEQE